MDTVITYRSIIEQVLTHYVEVVYAHGDIQNEPVFDRTAVERLSNRLGVSAGWKRVVWWDGETRAG